MRPFHMSNGNKVAGILDLVPESDGEARIAEDVQSITATGTVTLVIGGAASGQTRLTSNIVYLDPAGSDRTVTLPAEADWTGRLIIVNTADAAETLTIQNDAAATVAVVDQNEVAILACNGTTIKGAVMISGAASANDFGADGIKADVIAESTAANGVAVDGVTLKDGVVTGGLTAEDGDLIYVQGAGTGTGDVVQRVGGSATEGLELRVYEETVSPAAVETNLINMPVGSAIVSVQANVETALTGGGLTVTWSIGTTADPDKYGTQGYGTGAGVADALTINGKSNWMPATGFVFLTAAEQMVLTGTATGGAADGDTALTVGTVRVRVVYYALNSLDDA